MSRNAQSHFAVNPTSLDMSRSRFDRPYDVKTSFDVGDLVPFYCDEVLPGDTFDVTTSRVVRMQSLVTPCMDNLYLDMYYFFVPDRLVWSHWKQFMGENTESAWLPTTEYEVPQITSPADVGWKVGSIADYFGIPTGVKGLSVNALPFRAYALICNEWFRDENLMDPLNIDIGDTTVAGTNGTNYIIDCVKGGMPFKAAKYHDYFTSALPAPQKGPDVQIPVADAVPLPVYGTGKPLQVAYGSSVGSLSTLAFGSGNYMLFPYNASAAIGSTPSDSVLTDFVYGGLATQAQLGSVDSGLVAVQSGVASAATINQLRLAFQIQRLYEKDARGGSRYIELLKSHFGVTSPDARLQRPEYLGGNRIPININQVLQQSATVDGSTPQGNPVGMSLTTDTHHDFTKSFVEHGFVIGVMVARYDHTYQQGLDRMWSRKTRFDYYWPVLANIGEQVVKNKEIYAQGNDTDDEVFGYQEAWADYRYKPNKVTGEMRSNHTNSLDVWHFADDYDQLPALSASWIVEDKNNVDRVLAVQSSTSNQLFADILVNNRSTRAMPMYSVPGLIDHH